MDWNRVCPARMDDVKNSTRYNCLRGDNVIATNVCPYHESSTLAAFENVNRIRDEAKEMDHFRFWIKSAEIIERLGPCEPHALHRVV